MTKLRKHFFILIAYTVVALAMTFPLAANLTTAIPGVEGDAPSFVWALGWMKTALERGVNPFRSDFVFYPLGGATQLLWATSLIAFVSIPFQYLFGLIVTHNLFYLASTVVTAWGTYLLAEYVVRRSQFALQNPTFDATPLPPFQTLLLVKFITEQRRLAARVSPLACFIAGIVFAFAPLRQGYGLAFFNLFNTQLVPFYVLFLMRALREPSRRDSVIAGVLLGLNAYIDFQIAAFLILFTGWLIAYEWLGKFQERKDASSFLERFFASLRMTAQPVALTGVVALVVTAPMLAMVANEFALEGGNYIRVFPSKYSADRSYDGLAYLVPNALSTMYAMTPKILGVNGGINANDGSALSPDRQAFIGYLVLVLAACATLTQWRRARFWSIAAIVFALLSFGPSLHVLGRDLGVPMPYLILHEIPIVNHIRIPMRYGIMVSFSLAILAAIAIHNLQFKIRKANFILRLAFLLLPLFILAESANWPYPIQPVSMPRVYSTLAQQPGNFTVLEIPSFNWRFAASTEVYQAVHGKRILRAYTNRIAPDIAEYTGLRGTPIVVRSLRLLEGAEKGVLTPDEIAEDKRVRDAVVHFYDLRYAIVHRQWLSADQAQSIDAYLRDVLNARVVSSEGDTLAYEIPRAPSTSGAVKIDLRENVGQMYAGRGWQFQYPPANFDGKFNFVYARGAKSEIYFVANDRREHALTINAYADPPQRANVLLNGERIDAIDLKDAWRDYRIILPGRVLKAGMNRIELQYSAELNETVGVTTIIVE